MICAQQADHGGQRFQYIVEPLALRLDGLGQLSFFFPPSALV
jgi:hypothetical protein